jgi:uncharacterized protein (DUF433 family)
MLGRLARTDRITRDPTILDGEPVIAGTRVPVRAVVLSWRIHRSTRGMGEAFPTLSATDIGQALAYYRANRAEIDHYIAINNSDPA